MNRMHRHVRRLAIWALAAATALTVSTAQVANAAEVIAMDPATLPQGPANQLPHIVGDQIIDGDARIPVEAGSGLIAKTADGYLTKISTEGGPYPAYDLRLVTPTGSTTTIAQGNSIQNIKLSGDQKLLAFDSVGADDTLMTVISLPSGTLVKQQHFIEYRLLLAVEGDSLYLSGPEQVGAYRWNFHSGEVTQYSSARYWYDPAQGVISSPVLADPEHGLFAGVGDDGCPAVWKYERLVWRSCDEHVIAFNPTGKLFATRGVTDTTKNVIRMRGLRGSLQVTFTVNASVNSAQFESPDRLIVTLRNPNTGQYTYLRGWRTGANLAS